MIADLRRQRRRALGAQPRLTGIERLAVRRLDERHWRLDLDLVAAAGGGPADAVDGTHLAVSSDEPDAYRLRVERVSAEAPGRLTVVVAVPAGEPVRPEAERAVYRLELVDLEEVDPFFAAVDFRLRPGAAGVAASPPDDRDVDPGPDLSISYLAKDYASFRELMLGEMARELPEWRERNPTDLGVAIVESLAWAADMLSYYQDAVATEAYLGTARRRTSIARHVRLLDDVLREGNNARAWVEVLLTPGAAGEVRLPASTPLLAAGGTPRMLVAASAAQREALAAGCEVFETMSEAMLSPRRHRLPIHTWGIDDYALPAGSVSCTLRGTGLGLAAGDPLLLVEVRDPRTGRRADADPGKRHVVRLAAPPRELSDPLFGPVTEIAWFPEDALPFTLWVSRRGAGDGPAELAEARGNLVLADHGRTGFEVLPPVPARGPYRPHLDPAALTRRVPWDERRARRRPAREATVQDPGEALPAIVLYEVAEWLVAAASAGTETASAAGPPRLAAPAPPPPPAAPAADAPLDALGAQLAALSGSAGARAELGQLARWLRRWTPRRDLLGSGPFSRHFVVEGDLDHGLELRFGNGRQGARPAPGSRFVAVYRTGNGAAGNVGARSISVVIGTAPDLAGASNPLAAAGGSDPEEIETARLRAPQALHRQRRAVTRADYEELARQHPRVLDARATLSWTGAWTLALLRVQPRGGSPLDAGLRHDLRRSFRDLLLLGHELELSPPDWVPLEVVLEVRVAAGALPRVVERQLAAVLGSRQLPDGRQGYFHPDRFRFGDPVYLSQVVARAAEVPGVESVAPRVFRRRGAGEPRLPLEGRLPMGPHEVARCDQDPDDPRWGTLQIVLRERR